MSMSERGMPRRFLPGNASKFLHRRSMELLGLCLLTLAFSLLLINLTYNSADPSFNTTGSSETKNLLGSVGAAIADISLQGLGLANIAIIIVLGAWGIQLVSQRVIGRVIQRIFCLFIAIAMIATSFAALPTPDIWPLNTGLGGVTGWILFQQLVRVEEALNFSASLLVYVVALIGFTIFLWCLGIKVREYIFLARVIQRNFSLIVATTIKLVH